MNTTFLGNPSNAIRSWICAHQPQTVAGSWVVASYEEPGTTMALPYSAYILESASNSWKSEKGSKSRQLSFANGIWTYVSVDAENPSYARTYTCSALKDTHYLSFTVDSELVLEAFWTADFNPRAYLYNPATGNKLYNMNSLFGDTLDVFRLESDRNFTPKTEPEYIYRYSDSSEWTIPTIVTSQGDWKYDVVESESQFDIDAYNTLSPTVKTHNVLIKHNWDLVAVYPDYTW